jgi:DNA-binding XRE family transcriptional regulator
MNSHIQKMAKIERKEIKMDKVRNYPTINEAFDKEYGEVGTASREKFNEQSQAFFTGKIIEDARKSAHLTQDELAKRIGSTKSHISRIENGKTDPKLNTFFGIIRALGLTVELNPIQP